MREDVNFCKSFGNVRVNAVWSHVLSLFSIVYPNFDGGMDSIDTSEEKAVRDSSKC